MLAKEGVIALMPAVLPLISFLYVRKSDNNVIVTRDTWEKEYDYIVEKPLTVKFSNIAAKLEHQNKIKKCLFASVGAGSAGAVIASRLSEIPHVKVLLLEAGGSENIISDIPIAYQSLQQTPMDWSYVTEPQEAACFGHIERRSRWPRGRVLGGSSVINALIYNRGNRIDYDLWHQNGAVGWSWDEIFPYFLKSEDNRDPKYAFNGYHGQGGYLTVQTTPSLTPIGLSWPAAGAFLNYKTIDVNGPTQTGFTTPQGTLRRGARCSTAKAFLLPAKARPNLHVIAFSYVTRSHPNNFLKYNI
ncbi:glucose dehydrogenase (acceptor)-like protein 3 [Leptotrombidium deliense]|uniref:Glucose dehydrogenase (Acceptor)-like protein 3 n=1 Tax=Leptotrombidium deliense TaxID=299467 RepID=A0A443SG40_9ACAR|nr:glucose dehydrogenase (acceptor)-like protein 3 [Leptotrombidium deliense]